MPRWLFFRAPLGTKVELSKLDFVYKSKPFCYVSAKDSLDLFSLDIKNNAILFVSYARG